MLRQCLSAFLCALFVLSLAACSDQPVSPAGGLSSTADLAVSADAQVPDEASGADGETGGESTEPAEENSSQALYEESSTPVSENASTVVSSDPPATGTSSQNLDPVASTPSSAPSSVVSSGASAVAPPVSSEAPASQPASSAPASTIHVSMTITGLEGEILYTVDRYEVAEGSTVFTVLRDFAGQNGIEYEYDGGARSAYVTGIAGLHEFDHGKGSGWLYRVNGDFQPASVSCGSYPVYDGDHIEWLYTLDLGASEGAVF